MSRSLKKGPYTFPRLLKKVRELNELHDTMASYGEDLPFV